METKVEIITKAVKFGDCNILIGNSEGLLIDCGSSNRGNKKSSASFAYEKIETEISNKTITDIMVSHFDKDHFVGILEIPDCYKINTAYLPYSIIKKEVQYAEGMARLLAIAPPHSWGFQLSQNICMLFKKLEKISGNNIRFVKKGDTILFNENNMRVLWPKVDIDSVSDFIDGTGYRENKTNAELPYIFYDLINEDESILYAVREFEGSFRSYITALHETGEGHSAMYTRAYERLMEMRRLFRNKLSADKKHAIYAFAIKQYHRLIREMNALSIVFDCDKRFLFLGDATEKVVDHLATSFKNHYTFVKIPHHGTKHHFSSNIPAGCFNLISNGGYSNRKVSASYMNRGTIICTDAHKDWPKYCENAHGCSTKKCIKVNVQHPIPV